MSGSRSKRSVLDQLVESCSGSESEGEGEEEGAEGVSGGQGDAKRAKGEEVRADKKSKAEISLEDLQRAGYRSGPSVLLMKPHQEDQQKDWNWSDGKASKLSEPEQESWQERQQTHFAATDGATETGILAMKAAEHTERLREERRLEKQRQEQERKLSFNQKEKRKRDEGKTSRAKNYVEEEKRVGRSLGLYSGFD